MAIQVLASILLLTFSMSRGSLFNPTLEWTCGPTTMSIAIRTLSPFLGIAHPRGRLSTCNVTGSGNLLTKMTIPLWKDGNRCGVHVDQETGLYSVDVEVHEHRMLILEQDRIFHVTCDRKSKSLKIGDTDGEMLVASFNDDNATEQLTLVNDQTLPNREVEFNLELIPVVSTDDPVLMENMRPHDVGYGRSYDMKASLRHETDKFTYGKRFRISHCIAAADDMVVDLIDHLGCSIDKKIISNFEYGDGFAIARIPSMFKFPESKTMKLECSFALCGEFEFCKPSCDRKLDDPISEIEEAKAVAKIFGVNEESITDPADAIDPNNSNVASTIVHVLERREISVKSDKSFTTTARTPTTECIYSSEVIFLYKVIFGLSLLFILGTFINTLCCCVYCRRTKKYNDSLKSPGLVKNEYWISDPPNDQRDYQKDDPFGPFEELGRRDSTGSYASVKQRIIHPTDHMNNRFQLQETSSRSFKPTVQVPSSFSHPGNRQNSTFCAESSSGTSTWHESPGRSSHLDPIKESGCASGIQWKRKSKDSMEGMVWKTRELIVLRILHFQQHVRSLKRTSAKVIAEFCNECKYYVHHIDKLPEEERQNGSQHLNDKYELLVLGDTFRTQMKEFETAYEQLRNLVSLEKIMIVKEIVAQSAKESELASTKAALTETFNSFVFKVYPVIGPLTTTPQLLSHLSAANMDAERFNCNLLTGLSRKQREICTVNPEAMKAVVTGLRNAIFECRSQFADERWNCTGENGFGSTPLKVASKESAYVYALTAAGVSHALAQACARGLVPDCGCGDLPKEEYERTVRSEPQNGLYYDNTPNEFIWAGCSDNVKYGNSFGRRFIDSNEKQNQVLDARSLMNLHNNRVGRKLLVQSMEKKCKCHGVSGSCVTKTCWKAVPNFESFAQTLKKKYQRAKQVTLKPKSTDLMMRVDEYETVAGPRAERYLENKIPSEPRMRRAARNDLVFLEESPDYCEPDYNRDIFGPKGRECKDPDHCQKLCCGRGWETHRELKEEPCNCKFIWCCEVKCDTCVRAVDRHFCR